MKRYIGLALIGMLTLAPVGVKAQDSVGNLILALNLSQDQIDQVRYFFSQFAQKQAELPTAAELALEHRAQIREVITSAHFNQAAAQQVSQQISAIIAKRMVNRFELRNQIFQVLTSQQQLHYIQIIQQSLEGLE